jgi:Na+/H+ antiporter NhaC
MKNRQQHIALWKARATFAFLVVFCALISSMEFMPKMVHESDWKKIETSTEDTSSNENEALFNISVNAVVPVANVLSPQIFHFIFEIILPEKVSIGTFTQRIYTNEYFYKVLFERIISTNAP